MKRRQQQHGFTLLELLLYVTIFSVLIGAVASLAVLASAQKANSQITADINYQGEATMAYITQTIRQASSVTSPAAATSSSSLTLGMANAAVNPTVFSTFNDGTTTRLRVSEGSPAVNNNLTNARGTITNLTFTNMTVGSTKGSILVQFTLKYRTTSARQELQVSKTFYGAATLQ